jgi:hypothetical protein
MAACLVTISGSSGILKLNYIISSVAYSIETGVGTLYIESTATSVTYTTLSGNVTAASSCLTITAAPAVCNLLMWKGLNTNPQGYVADAIILGSETTLITGTSWPNSGGGLIDNINNVTYDKVKVIGYKRDLSIVNEEYSYEYYYILRTLGTDTPMLRVRNFDSTGYIYIPSTLSASCAIPEDYELITPCYSQTPITTTTTVAPTTTTTTLANVCKVYTILVTKEDIGNSTGNTVSSNNNKVFVVFTNCAGVVTTNSYVIDGLESSICVLSSSTPAAYYYQNNIQVSGTSVITDTGTSCTS